MSNRRSVGLAYNPRIPGTQDLVKRLMKRLNLGEDALVCSIQDLEERQGEHPGIDLLITVGGDGTILRVAHITAPHGVAILGINMGRVGFMTELSARDALDSVDQYLNNDLWIEERTMLQARIAKPGKGEGAESEAWESPALCHALNEAVVGSSAVARMATVKVVIDDAPLTVYRADSVIVATATGSTGYALSAGGPILHPLSTNMLLKPVAAHLGLNSALVLPSTSRIKLSVLSEGPASLSVDGFLDLQVGEDDEVLVEASPYLARFVRAQPPSHYYATLMQRFGLENGETVPRSLL